MELKVLTFQDLKKSCKVLIEDCHVSCQMCGAKLQRDYDLSQIQPEIERLEKRIKELEGLFKDGITAAEVDDEYHRMFVAFDIERLKQANLWPITVSFRQSLKEA